MDSQWPVNLQSIDSPSSVRLPLTVHEFSLCAWTVHGQSMNSTQLYENKTKRMMVFFKMRFGKAAGSKPLGTKGGEAPKPEAMSR